MNASIFHLVPSVRPYRFTIPSCPTRRRDHPYFLVPFLFFCPSTPFSRYRSLANGTRLPFAFIHRVRAGHPARASRDLCCSPLSLLFLTPRDRVGDTRERASKRARPDVSFFATADRHSPFSVFLLPFLCHTAGETRHVWKINPSRKVAKDRILFLSLSPSLWKFRISFIACATFSVAPSK